MNKLFSVFIILMVFQNLHSQTGFRQGFIITNNNDTIRGLINNRGYYKNSLACFFRSEDSSEVTEYQPFEIKGYRFTGDKFYVSKEIKIEAETKGIFAEFLVDGLVNLYFFREKDGTDHYYLEKEGDYFIELTNEKAEILKNGTRYVKYSDKYISLLRAAFKDCQIIQPELSTVKLNHNSLIKIVEKYQKYTCEYECIIYKKVIPPPVLSYGFSTGFSAARIYFKEAQGVSKISGSVPISGFINITTPLTNERLSLQLEIVYDKADIADSYFVNSSTMSYNYKGEYIWGTYNLYSKVSFKYQTISFPFLFKYEFPFHKTVPFFGFGITYNRIFNSEVNRSTSIFYENTIEPYLKKQYKLKSHTTGFLFDLGIEYKLNKKQSVFIKARYNFYRNEIINDPVEKLYHVNSAAIVAGIRF